MQKKLLVIILIFTSQLVAAQTENFWVKKADFAGLKRERAIAFTIGQLAYVGTGVDTAEIVYRDLWSYDPVADVWAQLADNPGQPRRNAIAFSIGNYGYVGTGINANSVTETGATKLKDFWQYDPALNTWTQKADYPGGGGTGVYFATGFAVDSKGYICGGKMGPNWYSNHLWEYKPVLDQWTQLANFPGGVRYQHSSFVIDYNAFVGLGTDQDMYRKDFWKFDVSTNQWSAIADLPASERAASMTFTLGQRGYVCMGTNGGYLEDLWEYNPFANSWSSRATYDGAERKGGVGFSINGKGYVGLGKGYSGKKQSLYEYTPPAILDLAEQELKLLVYPNPVISELHIQVDNAELREIRIYSLSGREVKRTPYQDKIDLRDLQGGYYLIHAIGQNDQVLASKPFIKN